MKITELSKTKAAKFAMLKQRKQREKEGLFLVQGIKAVTDSLGVFEAEAILVKKGGLKKLPDFPDCTIYETSDADLKKISTLENLPDAIAIMRIPEEGESEISINKEGFTLMLDGIQDPGNMGTIIRCAHWFGIRQIICSPDTVEVYNPKVVQSTMGSLGKVKTVYAGLEEVLKSYPDIPRYGLVLKGENIFGKNSFAPGFIIMGNEGHGISEGVKKLITDPLTIPPVNPLNHPESLNVSVATAITLSQIIR